MHSNLPRNFQMTKAYPVCSLSLSSRLRKTRGWSQRVPQVSSSSGILQFLLLILFIMFMACIFKLILINLFPLPSAFPFAFFPTLLPSLSSLARKHVGKVPKWEYHGVFKLSLDVCVVTRHAQLIILTCILIIECCGTCFLNFINNFSLSFEIMSFARN